MTTLITGASSGIGYEMAKIFAQNGYNLVLIARRTGPMEEIRTQFPDVQIRIIGQDLAEQNAGQKIYNLLKDQKIDVLVNNAGFGDTGEFHTLNLQKQMQMIDLNVRVLTEMTHLFGSDMVSRKSGKILNVASVVAFMAGPKMATYFATKAFVLSFSQALSQEWGKFGVQVLALCPGLTASGFQEVAVQTDMQMIKNSKIPTSQEVAQYGYNKLMQGETLIVHGFLNKVITFLPRILPRKLYLMIIENSLK